MYKILEAEELTTNIYKMVYISVLSFIFYFMPRLS